MKKILFFASGSGSNVENIINYFQKKSITIDYKVICNKAEAGIYDRCERLEIPIHHFSKQEMETLAFEQYIVDFAPDLIVLAGFLLKFPEKIIKKFPEKIINIHPALLPKYGGKGMYGMHVHRAVLENKESKTGITIHFVNENYDEGKIILQKDTNIEGILSAEEIAQKVHALEYHYFPIVIEQLLFPDNSNV